jgi:signal transduction histidine kinase
MQKERTLPNKTILSHFWRVLFPPFTWGTSILYMIALIAGLFWLLASSLWLNIALYCAAILALFVLDRIEYRRYGPKEQTPRRAAIIFLCLRLVCSEGAILCVPEVALILCLMLPFYAMFYFGRKAAYGMAGAISGFYLLEIWFDPRANHSVQTMLLEVYIFALACISSVAMARTVGLEMESRQREQASRLHTEALLEEVRESQRQLQIYARQVADLATLEERNRIAREIHDSLGHSLLAIALQLDKALAYRTVDPEEAQQAVSDARQVTKAALQDVRHSVRALRNTDEKFSCVHEIQALAEQLRKSGLHVQVTIDGQEEHFSRQILLTLYRVAQEGFTNIQKHAHAQIVEICLCFTEEQASLVISDDGIGFDAASRLEAEGGHTDSYGLRGIQERVNLLGATFHIESTSGHGTRLTIHAREPQEEAQRTANGLWNR